MSRFHRLQETRQLKAEAQDWLADVLTGVAVYCGLLALTLYLLP